MTVTPSFLTVRPDRRGPDDDSGVDRSPRPVASRVRELPPGRLIDTHHHRRAQLLFASKGTMIVTTDQGVWVVPPQRAVWIPELIDHATLARSRLSLRSLYFSLHIVPDMPRDCAVVTVSSLLRELILAAVILPADYDEGGADGRLIAVLLDQIRTLPETPLHLPMPADGRLKPIVETLSREPADARSLEDWAATVGASSRTLTRLFAAEMGMTFRQWRQQVRLLEALARLADGESVTALAIDLGYESQSAFITMFRRSLGTTPGRYFDDRASS